MKKHHLILIVIAAGLLLPAAGEAQPSQSNQQLRPGRINPPLTGMKEVRLVIVPHNIGTYDNQFFLEQLRKETEKRLSNSGIITAPDIYATIAKQPENVFELRIEIDRLQIAERQTVLFRSRTALLLNVLLQKYPRRLSRAEVWVLGGTIQPTSEENIPSAITDLVMAQIEAFISAYRQANPDMFPAPKAKDVSVTAKKQAKSAAKSIEVECKYVSSSGSKIFHKADCRAAKRILAKNLISYQSREKAIKAGRRPCKLCKP
ncbi:MAG: hypothetical protein ACYSYU_07675 [Planctomycetota bacterium]|jgi:hypothetical protein